MSGRHKGRHLGLHRSPLHGVWVHVESHPGPTALIVADLTVLGMWEDGNATLTILWMFAVKNCIDPLMSFSFTVVSYC